MLQLITSAQNMLLSRGACFTLTRTGSRKHYNWPCTLVTAIPLPNLLGFLLRDNERYLNSQVCQTPAQSAMDLVARIAEAAARVPEILDLLELVPDCIRRQCEA